MKHNSSFRDDAGYIFIQNNKILRFINKSYKKHYELLMSSGLYKELTKKHMLISHEEINDSSFIENKDNLYMVIEPVQIPFITYPYEWSFSQLKDAALLTLEIQLEAINHGMTLKDASSFNIQFLNGKPIFIDTLSFEENISKPWEAYGQFCRHFLAPLTLISYTDKSFYKELMYNIDGIKLSTASKLLPFKTKLNLSLYMHIHLHAKIQSKISDNNNQKNEETNLPVNKQKQLIKHLIDTVHKLKYNTNQDIDSWKDYYTFTNYNEQAFTHKEELIKQFISQCDMKKVILDLGANNGHFSRIIANTSKDSLIISSDIDYDAVNDNYLRSSKSNTNIISMILDITNPASAIGWANKERISVLERINKCDVITALALIHHLVITNNIPFDMVSKLFASITTYLIIEWVPKDDTQTIKIINSEDKNYEQYTQENFELFFSNYFDILNKENINNTKRILYLMKTKLINP